MFYHVWSHMPYLSSANDNKIYSSIYLSILGNNAWNLRGESLLDLHELQLYMNDKKPCSTCFPKWTSKNFSIISWRLKMGFLGSHYHHESETRMATITNFIQSIHWPTRIFYPRILQGTWRKTNHWPLDIIASDLCRWCGIFGIWFGSIDWLSSQRG